MTTAITTKEETFSLVPRNFDEALKFAEYLSKSNMIPKSYIGKPGDILVSMQMGHEVGLKPLQALQNIAAINGRPSIWGDAALALCKQSPLCVDVIETLDETTMIATCIAKRKGNEDVIRTFSQKDAQVAKLWGKEGSWSQYPKRMISQRARGFALRDQFPDILKGLVTVEEAMDYPMEDVTPASAPVRTRVTSEYIKEIQDELTKKPSAVNVRNEQAFNDNLTVAQNMDVSHEPLIQVQESKEKTFARKINENIMTHITEDVELPHEMLNRLIREKRVDGATVSSWLRRAQVEEVHEMPVSALTACINLLQTSEKYNNININERDA